MQRRTIGIVIAALALVGAALGSGALHRFHDRGLRRLAAQLSGNARTLVRTALADKLKLVENNAVAAGQLQQIRGQIAAFDSSTAATLRDGFKSEPWWAPFRNDYSIYGVSLEGNTLGVLEGMDAQSFEAGPLIEQARAHRQASGIVIAGPKHWPYATGAAVIDAPGRPAPAVVVLAQAVDQMFAQELAAKAGGAVLVSDGKQPMLVAGKDSEEADLKTVVGKESQDLVAGDDGSWAASPTLLVPGLWLWSYANVGAQADEYRQDDSTGRLAIWGLGALVAAAALILTLRKAPVAPLPAPGPTGATGEAPGTAGKTSPSLGDTEGATAIQKAPPAQNVFGRYVLLDRLGEGGMAEVYTAVTYGVEGFRRTFVVKRLRPEMAKNNDVVAAFIDEANLASSLVHTNIVPVFDFGKVGDEYYMAQEYILGRDLGRVNRRALEREQKPLPMNQVFYAAHETLKALDYAHGKTGPDGKPMGLVHRDVSPNNILVSARGEVKLFDFGIAKAANRITRTQFGMVKGNVRFMSPEQARGEAVDSRSDLFSVALVIYYALSGDALYTADTAYNLLVKAAQGPGAKELETLGKLPKEAQRILERGLQPNPADRFQTAAEFAQALAPFLSGAHDALARTMERLFTEDIRAEEARFAAAAASGTARAPEEGDSGATVQQQATSRFAQPAGKG